MPRGQSYAALPAVVEPDAAAAEDVGILTGREHPLDGLVLDHGVDEFDRPAPLQRDLLATFRRGLRGLRRSAWPGLL